MKGIPVRALAHSTKKGGSVVRDVAPDASGQPPAGLDQGEMLLKVAGSDGKYTRGAKEAGFRVSSVPERYTTQDSVSCFSSGQWWSSEFQAPANDEYPFQELLKRQRKALEAGWKSAREESILALYRLRQRVSRFQQTWGAEDSAPADEENWVHGPWTRYGRLLSAVPRNHNPGPRALSIQPEPDIEDLLPNSSQQPPNSPGSQASLSIPLPPLAQPGRHARHVSPPSPSLGGPSQRRQSSPPTRGEATPSPPRVHSSQRRITATAATGSLAGRRGSAAAGHKRSVADRGSLDEGNEASKRSRAD
jgi:hypothetical protein